MKPARSDDNKIKDLQQSIKMWRDEIVRLEREIKEEYNKVKDFGSASFERTEEAIQTIENKKRVIKSYTNNLNKYANGNSNQPK